MIITQTPLRISFFGGGTDYPEYFAESVGAVLGTAIDKYAYFSVMRFYSELFDYSIRLAYRRAECVQSLDQIEHAPFRECLRRCGVTNNVEINYSAELPAFSGLGSSSTFVVGLLHTLHAYKGEFVQPLELAYEAIEVEREALKESVGCQDQLFAAVGGLNVIEFRGVRDAVVERVPLRNSRLREFEAHLMVFHTGIRRHAEELASRQVQRVGANRETLLTMRKMVDEGHDILVDPGRNLSEFGEVLHRAWSLKQTLADGITNEVVNTIYQAGIEAGALGGKLLGAGGGGSILLFVPPERQPAVRRRLAHLGEIPVRINAPGSRVIHASPSGGSEA